MASISAPFQIRLKSTKRTISLSTLSSKGQLFGVKTWRLKYCHNPIIHTLSAQDVTTVAVSAGDMREHCVYGCALFLTTFKNV